MAPEHVTLLGVASSTLEAQRSRRRHDLDLTRRARRWGRETRWDRSGAQPAKWRDGTCSIDRTY